MVAGQRGGPAPGPKPGGRGYANEVKGHYGQDRETGKGNQEANGMKDNEHNSPAEQARRTAQDAAEMIERHPALMAILESQLEGGR